MLYFLVLFFYSAANQRRGSGKTIGRLASALLLALGSARAPGWVVDDSLGRDWEVWILRSIQVLRSTIAQLVPIFYAPRTHTHTSPNAFPWRSIAQATFSSSDAEEQDFARNTVSCETVTSMTR